MNSRKRGALLGLVAGVAYTAVRLFFPRSGVITVGGPDLDRLVFETFVNAVVLLAVIPGFVLYAAREMDWATRADATTLAVLVGVGTLVGVAVSTPVLTAIEENVALHVPLETRFLATYVVNGVGPSVHAAVGALAGMLLAERNT